jgi:hypothetical protein
MASSYGWAGVIAGIVALAGMLWWGLASMRRRAADAATTAAIAAGNARVSDANAAAVDSRAVDRGPTPGVIVHDRQKPTGDL